MASIINGHYDFLEKKIKDFVKENFFILGMIKLILLKAKGFHIVNYTILLLILYIFAL